MVTIGLLKPFPFIVIVFPAVDPDVGDIFVIFKPFVIEILFVYPS
jgi:hypothetical protein